MQGNGWAPGFSPNGATLYYLRSASITAGTRGASLMAVDLSSFRVDNLFPDLLVDDYDISPNGKRVVFSSTTKDGTPQLWVASLDRRSPPQAVPAPVPLDQPGFISDEEICFRALENGKHFLQRAHLNGAGRHSVFAGPVSEVGEISPDRKWVAASEPAAGERSTVRFSAHAADGSRSIVLCDVCQVRWTPDGKTMYFNFFFGAGRAGETVAVLTVPGQLFPPLPPQGLSLQEALKLPGAKHFDRFVSPSPIPGVFAYQKAVVQRNIYRIPLK